MNEINLTTMHHFICAMCDCKKCVRGTDECDFEKWKKKRADKENDSDTDKVDKESIE